jgi:hypothetical protein
MESTLRNPPLTAAAHGKRTGRLLAVVRDLTWTAPNTTTIVYWIVTALFCLEMLFTAYYELVQLPAAAEAFSRLGFTAGYFRIELSWAKVAGVAALLLPMVPARLKEWAYAGFAFNLASALIAHFSMGDGPRAWAPSTTTSVFWGLSYFFWRRLQAVPGSAGARSSLGSEKS